MDITSVPKMYQTKLQEINSRIPQQTNIKDKFSSYLENAKLKTYPTENIEVTSISTENVNESTDTNELLSSLLTYNSGLNSTSSLFTNTDSNNSIFPSMNSSLQVLQQAALLKSLKADNE